MSSSSATSSATSNSVFNSILEKSGTNTYVSQATCNVSSGGIEGLDRDGDNLSRTDLDYHANMVVVGKHAAIINDTGRKVSPFTPDYESLSKVLIVDAAVTYDCP